jgi:hypothetical protein
VIAERTPPAALAVSVLLAAALLVAIASRSVGGVLDIPVPIADGSDRPAAAPLVFARNGGQTDGTVRYEARGAGHPSTSPTARSCSTSSAGSAGWRSSCGRSARTRTLASSPSGA